MAVTGNPELFEALGCIDEVISKPHNSDQIATALYLSKVRIGGKRQE